MTKKVNMVSICDGVVAFQCAECEETLQDPEDLEDVDYDFECPECGMKIRIHVEVV